MHEWVEVDPALLATPVPERVAAAEDAGLRQRNIDLAKRASQGPPVVATDHGSASSPITWVFESESFAPAAKLVGQHQHAIITDHLGTPTAMLDAEGRPVWSADIGAYGELRNITGDKSACPFRWPGQYEDEETGLYYNRFRYYDPESGEYVSQDPMGLGGGLRHHAYASDSTTSVDFLGLAACRAQYRYDARLKRYRDTRSGRIVRRTRPRVVCKRPALDEGRLRATVTPVREPDSKDRYRGPIRSVA